MDAITLHCAVRSRARCIVNANHCVVWSAEKLRVADGIVRLAVPQPTGMAALSRTPRARPGRRLTGAN